MNKKVITVLPVAFCLLLLACGSSKPAGNGAESIQPPESMTETAATLETEKTPETSSEADTEALSSSTAIADGTYEGIVVDAAMNSFMIDTPEGRMLSFAMPEDGVRLRDGMLLGIPVKVFVKDGAAVSLTDGSKEPKASREALEFAGSILFAVEYKNQQELAALAGYPMYVNLDGKEQTVKDAESFEKLDAEKLFSAQRVQAVLGTNLYALEELEGGTYVMGDESGKPNVIFQKDEGNDRGFSVTGIN